MNYEAGVKSRMLNGVLDFNGSIFYYDYKNLQNFSTQNSALYVFNVDAWVRGAEFDMVIRPMRGLNFSASASYLDSKAKNV
ncbi:TonB-dependent receptor domain-containing protein, partial [Salmonella sp. M134]|uniref:TonB-dependent receptor domain-containing protein n=1 Tax=Salmonella sp. M134 TaxID=3240288 RepID=UPI00352B7978